MLSRGGHRTRERGPGSQSPSHHNSQSEVSAQPGQDRARVKDRSSEGDSSARGGRGWSQC